MTEETITVTEPKWWGESMTIWGALLTAVSTVLPVIGPLLGINITGELITALGEHLVQVVQALGGLAGILMTVLGRVREALAAVEEGGTARRASDERVRGHPREHADQGADRVEAVVAELGSDAQVGFHGHENLSLSLANTIKAIEAGAVQVDGSTRRFGAGSGATSCEALAAVAEKMGIRTGLDVLKMIDAAEDVVRPVMDGECVLDRLALIMGYAGVYSSFLKHAYRAAERYGVSGADILMECGNRHLVGGQEDQIIEIAANLARV